MRIALDFDRTFTRDPGFWLTVISEAEASGHEVVIVTARCETKDGICWPAVPLGRSGRQEPYTYHGMAGPPCPVIWCDGKPKREVAKGIDIWIDDDPYSLIHGSQFTPETLVAWREQDVYRNPANGPKDPQRAAHNDGRPRLFSARDRSGSGSLPQGK